jgi:hypothetical protein
MQISILRLVLLCELRYNASCIINRTRELGQPLTPPMRAEVTGAQL